LEPAASDAVCGAVVVCAGVVCAGVVCAGVVCAGVVCAGAVAAGALEVRRRSPAAPPRVDRSAVEERATPLCAAEPLGAG
jgi:hypothetical protein